MSRKLKLALLIINTLVILWLIWNYLHGSMLSLAIAPANILVYATRKKYPYLSAFIVFLTIVGALLATYTPNLSVFTEPIVPVKLPVNATKP
jgi:signal transduction histidine kinase